MPTTQRTAHRRRQASLQTIIIIIIIIIIVRIIINICIISIIISLVFKVSGIGLRHLEVGGFYRVSTRTLAGLQEESLKVLQGLVKAL